MSLDSGKALLSFKLGPVQPFIESARTLRDLWAGSYLLSWLTAHAMKPVIEKCGVDAFITPHVTDENPLLRAVRRNGPTHDPAATLSCLPHTFAAEVPAAEAKALGEASIKACAAEWKAIADAVKAELQKVINDAYPGWNRDWDAQIASFFEFRCVTLPFSKETADALERLKVPEDTSQETDEDKLWSREWNLLGALMDVSRSVRHVPPYVPVGDNNRYPVKCSLLGSFEQMGLAELKASNEFWAKLTKLKPDRSNSPGWDGLDGTRLQSRDKLCAVSLVKRFAWPAYFAKTPRHTGRLGVHVHELKFADTATIAAARWLPSPDELPDADDEDVGFGKADWRTLSRWSGQWLHWATPNQDPDEKPCPKSIWDDIQAQKSIRGRPPAYYALLHLDGDNMGEFFQGEKGKAFGSGKVRFRSVTEQLTRFSLKDVKRIVEDDHSGELIYAGGDDVLAILPTETAVACARDLHAAFRAEKCLRKDATLSGGIAVVHYKEDLRFALHEAREAEKAAKKIGRQHGNKDAKNALAIAVCRRSGEHASVVMGWGQTDLLTQLVTDFRAGASDRWAYKLRTELPTLETLPLGAGKSETLRLVGRSEAAPDGFKERIEKLFDHYRDEMQSADRNWPPADVLKGFVTLCQSASFLARGRD
ncbi:type III-B CRISPR-associated protein Cas10/Cmr2 [Fimbriiglobus ruber]|uniref:CRISPR-associated RAMP Cmr2 n=1 Tax=Fimbriiglobus ruber TaxID=1908690 RepID=A0A225DYC0_9BACT|nr:type III-B CRISPR-associated protein Cas10/Cmr2 [Fimbriiglobus ruber]OWK41127.1 CRISPR-associated RAMP Cmr2 [Fimbriiglobus ruber]